MIFTILIFIIVLGVLVFVHELGHFVVARRSGMATEEFGFGFPPRLIGIQKINGKWNVLGHRQADPNHTVYSINWIPFGAFVRIRGENGDSVDPKSFIRASWIKRFLVLVAGVGMNVLAAWVLFSIGLATGVPSADVTDVPKFAKLQNVSVGITSVKPESPAEQAGFKIGDSVVAVNSISIQEPEKIQEIVGSSIDRNVEVTVKRGEKVQIINVTPIAGLVTDRGAIGVQLAKIGTLKYEWFYAPIAGAKVTLTQIVAIANGLFNLVTAGVGVRDIAGPFKIAQITGQAAELGFGYLVQFAAFLSLNLAVLNILPFPALDGGRVLFLILEKIRGKALNKNFEQWANALGFIILLLLVATVTVNDIRSFEFIKQLFK